MAFKDPEKGREYYLKNHEYYRKYREANREKARETSRKWRESNPGKQRENNLKYYAANVDELRERSRKYGKDNREKVRDTVRKWRKMNPDKQRERSRAHNLKRNFGISSEYYDKMFSEREGLCDICSSPETIVDKRSGKVRRLHVDHDHDTEIVRGLLCSRCNTGVGLLGDSIPRLIAAVDYLEHTTRGEE